MRLMSQFCVVYWVSHGVYYELESGSALGGVKLSNFIPWDIDMDIREDVTIT